MTSANLYGICWTRSECHRHTEVCAWSAFYDAFDFTSALHNAMRLPGDKHINGILVGTLAEAMCGCEVMMLKHKYCVGGETIRRIILPKKS